MKILLSLVLLTFMQPVSGELSSTKPKVINNLKHLVLADEPTLKFAKSLSQLEIKTFKVSKVNLRETLEKLGSEVSKKKGDLIPLVFLDVNPKQTLVSFELKATNYADCLDEICKNTGLKWTILFYMAQENRPILVIGSKKGILKHRESKEHFQPK